jgi:UDP-N-acetylglucosamine:LPS N-acetylglucosamine transferase
LSALRKKRVSQIYSEVPGYETTHFYLENAMVKLANILLDVVMPDVTVLMTEGILPCKALAKASNRKHIPVLLYLQQGILSKSFTKKFLYATRIAVSGKYLKNFLVEEGVDEKQIVVTGQPLYDKIKKSRMTPRSSGSKVIVYCTDNFPKNEATELAVIVCNAFKKLQNVELIIKIHPMEDEKLYKHVTKELAVEALLLKKIDILDVLQIADVMVTSFSTAALDAMVLGKHVITLNFTGKPDKLPYVSSGSALGVYDPEKLPNALNAALYDKDIKAALDKNMKRLVEQYVYGLDGHSGDRVADLICQMVCEKGGRMHCGKKSAQVFESQSDLVGDKT